MKTNYSVFSSGSTFSKKKELIDPLTIKRVSSFKIYFCKIYNDDVYFILQVTLNWIQQKPGITSPLIGARTVTQLEENLKSLEFK